MGNTPFWATEAYFYRHLDCHGILLGKHLQFFNTGSRTKIVRLKLFKGPTLLIVLFQFFYVPCNAEESHNFRLKVLYSDIKISPNLWMEGLENFLGSKELVILSAGTAATLLVWHFKDDIRKEIQRNENYQSFASEGDDFGLMVSRGLPQVGVYFLGLSLKNDKLREFGLLTTNAAIFSGLLTSSLKLIINSKRPDGSSYTRFDSSFPSGHAAGTAALAATIHQRYGFWYAVPFQLGSFLSGISRIVENRHRPHEVMAGWALGYISGYALARAWGKIRPSTNNFSLKPWMRTNSETQVGLSLQMNY